MTYRPIPLEKSTATLVVAASDSLHKERADYVCDGVDDEDTISDAIVALPDDGGKIVLLDGTFNLTGVAYTTNILTITESNVIIEGQGKATHIKVVGNEGGAVIYFNGVSNCVIRDVWVDGNDLGGYAIQFTDSSKCKVLNCIAGNTWADGIAGANLSYSLIKGNIVYDCETGAHGDVSSGIELEDGCNSINVEDNYLSDCGCGIWPKRHSGSPLTHDISIVRNILYNSPISITSEDASPLENINVIGNTLLGTTTARCIRMANVINSSICNNILHSPVSTYGGISLSTVTSDILIDGNNIYSASNDGIQVRGNGHIVSNNYIKDAVNVGIYILNALKCTVHGNHVDGSGARGMYINSSQTNIIGNLVKNSASSGIRTQNQQNLVFIGNVCFDDQGTKTQTYGIDLNEWEGTCDNNTIIGNNVVGNKDGGIAITEGSNANTIIKDNVGYTNENSGNSTGTDAQQTIAHGLAATPTKIILWNIGNGANAYQSAAADATNIYITAVVNQDYGWEAEV